MNGDWTARHTAPLPTLNIGATDVSTNQIDALTREVSDLRKRLDKIEREAEARARTAHYPPARPLREPSYRTLGKRADDSGIELD